MTEQEKQIANNEEFNPQKVNREETGETGETADFPRENVSATLSPFALDNDPESIATLSGGSDDGR